MNTDQLKGKWNQIKGNAKQKYGVEMDDEETFSEGKLVIYPSNFKNFKSACKNASGLFLYQRFYLSLLKPLGQDAKLLFI